MTPNYIDSSSLSVAPWCDCSNSGNDIDECRKFLNFFQDNTCLSKYRIKICHLGSFSIFYGISLLFEYVVIRQFHLFAHGKHGSAVGVTARMEQTSAKKYSWFYSLWTRL